MTENSSNQDVGKRVLSELRTAKEKGPFQPTNDIDIVWVISGPGTVKSPPEKGPYASLYKGKLADRELVVQGINLVKQVTALNLDVANEAVTKQNIAESGPILFYNGENLSHPNANFAQNEDLKEWIEKDDFPLHPSKVVIQNLAENNTNGQIKNFAEFTTGKTGIKKVAVVAGGAHMPRVLRGLKKYESLFPSVEFVAVYVRDTIAPVGRTLGEIRRIKEYTKPEKDYISKDPII